MYLHFFFALLFLSTPLCSTESRTPATAQEIDGELETLQQQLSQLRKEELNTEVEGQAYLREDNSAYTQKLLQEEKKGQEAKKIMRRIAELQTKKQALESQSPP
jgi:hypothetical protein